MNHNIDNELPEKVKVFRSLDQIKPIRVYAKSAKKEGKQFSTGYMKMFQEGRILPRVPYYGVDGRKYVDCVIGEVSSIRVFRKNKKHLDGDFVKTLKQGLVLTPTQGIVVRQFRNKLSHVLTKKKAEYTASVAQAKKAKDAASVAQARKAEQDDFEMYKRDNTGFKSVYFRFVCETRSVLDDDVPVISKYKY